MAAPQCGPGGLGLDDSGLWGSGCTLRSWTPVPWAGSNTGVRETQVPRAQHPAPPGTPVAGLGEEHPLPAMSRGMGREDTWVYDTEIFTET